MDHSPEAASAASPGAASDWLDGLPLPWIAAALLAIVLLCAVSIRALASPPEAEVFARGLIHPRGLVFGPDGNLYVAEAGNGGPDQVDVGRDKPHAVGRTGRVSRISPSGVRTTLVDGLPSIFTAANEEVGPSGLTFIGDQLYLLTAAGGWEMGDPAFHNSLELVRPDGTLQRIIDLSAYIGEHPAQARLEDPRADVPLGMPYGLSALNGRFYLTEANQEQVFSISLDGEVTRLLTYPKSNRALTGITPGPDGALYIAELAGNQITRLSPDGQTATAVAAIERPIDVAFDSAGQTYVLQYYLGRLSRGGTGARGPWQVVADKLPLPTAMAFGPDGNLYLSTGGSRARFEGQIMRLRMPPAWLGPLRALLPWVGGVALAGFVTMAVIAIQRRLKRRSRVARRRRRAPTRAAPV